MTGNSAERINDIAERSNEMRMSNEQGYRKLQDAREAVCESGNDIPLSFR